MLQDIFLLGTINYGRFILLGFFVVVVTSYHVKDNC